MKPFQVDPDIRKAVTLPAAFYEDPAMFEQAAEKIFAGTWQYVADARVLGEESNVYPFTLLPGVLDEPLLLTRDAGGHARCLSNVCTHRGKVIVEQPGKMRQLTCGYHGRCFGLDGAFKRMPEFQQEDLTGIKCIVHFENESDMKDFEKLVGQHIPDNTKSIWYPKKEWADMASLRYVNES